LTKGPAEPNFRVPDAKSIGGAFREALSDFFYNSWRLVPANALWGVGLLACIVLFFAWPLPALLVIPLLALPGAGIFRLATLIVRQRAVALSDAFAWRRFIRPALLTGLALTLVTIVLGTNMLLGFSSGEPLLWVLATAAGWGLLATWVVALPFWPLLLDPARAGTPILDTLKLAATLVFISPGRFAALFLLVAVLFVASLVFFAALLTISVAFIALLLAHYTLPAADRFEQRPTQQVFS
jgi:hypothetical protein